MLVLLSDVILGMLLTQCLHAVALPTNVHSHALCPNFDTSNSGCQEGAYPERLTVYKKGI